MFWCVWALAGWGLLSLAAADVVPPEAVGARSRAMLLGQAIRLLSTEMREGRSIARKRVPTGVLE